jgi:arginyl-tRNA synthetase
MDLFGQSVQAAALGKPTPEDGYHGEYIQDLAKSVLAAKPGIDTVDDFREAAYQLQLAQQQSVLTTFRTHFDVWFSERSLHESGAVDHGLEKLREQGHVFETEGAVWLRTTDFDDDKDRVLVKENGDLTYFAVSVALIFASICWEQITMVTSIVSVLSAHALEIILITTSTFSSGSSSKLWRAAKK